MLKSNLSDYELFIRRSEGISALTKNSYIYNIRRIIKYLSRLDFGEHRSLSSFIESLFHSWQYDESPRLSAYNCVKQAMSSYLSYLHNAGVIEYPVQIKRRWNPSKQEVFREYDEAMKKKLSAMSETEIKQIMDRALEEDPRLYILLLCMYNLGLRADDVISLRRNSIQAIERRSDSKITYILRVYGKSERVRRKPFAIAIPDEMAHTIYRYMDAMGLTHSEDAIIPTYRISSYSVKRKNPNQPVGPLSKKKLGDLIKGVTDEVLGRELTSHYIRRSRATNLLMSGHNHYDIGRLMRLSPNTLVNHYDMRVNTHNLEQTFVGVKLPTEMGGYVGGK